MKLISEEKNALLFSVYLTFNKGERGDWELKFIITPPPSYIDQSIGMLITDHMSLIYPLGIIDNKDTGRDIITPPPSHIDQSTGMLITDHMSLIYPL